MRMAGAPKRSGVTSPLVRTAYRDHAALSAPGQPSGNGSW